MTYLSTIRSVYGLLSAQARRRAATLFLLLVAAMVLETLGIGLVIPAMALLVETDPGAAYPATRGVLTALGNPSHDRLVTMGMLALLVVYAVKAMFLGFVGWYQNRFAFSVQEHTSSRLFATYLYQPYTFHLQRNSAQLIRNIFNEADKLWFLCLNPTLVVLSEGLVLLGVICLLVLLQPVGALIQVLILGVGGWAFSASTRAQLLRLGFARQELDGLRIQQLQEGLGGVKEVKLLGRERHFLGKYDRHNADKALVERRHATLQLVPRLGTEVLAVAGLAALVLIMMARGGTASGIVPTLALFAAAAFRLIPSAHRLIAAVQHLSSGLPVVAMVREELRLAPGGEAPQAPRPAGGAAMQHEIRLVDVDYTYPDAVTPALTGVSLVVRKGESVGFVGTSGSGKTTAVDLVLGLLTPTGGQVRVDGRDIQADLRGWQRQIGYVPQSVYLTDDTLRNNVAFGIAAQDVDEAAVERAVAAAQLDRFVASLPAGLDTFVGERGVRLSGGQRQRIGIARALYHEPCVLVLDEATSALDRHTEEGVMEAVAALRDKTIIVVAHRLSTVERCSTLYRFDRGGVTLESVPVHAAPLSSPPPEAI